MGLSSLNCTSRLVAQSQDFVANSTYRYWRPTFPGAGNYSFVDAAVAAGYSVLSYDRIGVGSSSRYGTTGIPSGRGAEANRHLRVLPGSARWTDARFQVEAAVLNSLVDYARKNTSAAKVALVGHSYGSYLSAASADAKLLSTRSF